MTDEVGPAALYLRKKAFWSGSDDYLDLGPHPSSPQEGDGFLQTLLRVPLDIGLDGPLFHVLPGQPVGYGYGGDDQEFRAVPADH